MDKIIIKPGQNKLNAPETYTPITLSSGNVYTIVGKTGSGKSQFINDIESYSQGDGITKRVIINPDDDNKPLPTAHLSQNMQFVLDLSVKEFITKRLPIYQLNNSSNNLYKMLELANDLCGEPIHPSSILTRLSGGQSRALMIADIALNTQAKVVLIDEIENAGIDKIKAINLLLDNNKIILVVTHDPLLALHGKKRIVMEAGGIKDIISRTAYEKEMLTYLYDNYKEMEKLRSFIRKGKSLNQENCNKIISSEEVIIS